MPEPDFKPRDAPGTDHQELSGCPAQAPAENADSDLWTAWLADAPTSHPTLPPGLAPQTDVFDAQSEEEPVPHPHQAVRLWRLRPRRRTLPVVLFLLTCVSTFFVGACAWVPTAYVYLAYHTESLMPIRRVIVRHWTDGLLYMACVLAILLAHEMGHFLATLRYRIPASYPYFLPLPISPIGTLGAVIGMDGFRANRKEIFDIGIAGPLAGLVVAAPILCIGILKLDFTQPEFGVYQLDMPLVVRILLDHLGPHGYVPGQRILHGHLNPYFMAGWVGLLVTGLNMMPVSQLDGGHVIYTLLGKRSRWVARGFILTAIAYIFVTNTHAFWLMVVLIMLVGTDHPPTRDDSVPLGWCRTLLGICSLAIPIFCFAPRVLILFPESAGGM